MVKIDSFSKDIANSVHKILGGNQAKYLFPQASVISKGLSFTHARDSFLRMTGVPELQAGIQFKNLIPQISPMSQVLAGIQVNPLFPEINAITNLIKKSDKFITTYNDVISLNLQAILVSDEDDNNIIAIKNKIDTNFYETKKTKLSLDFYYSTILTLLLFAYNENSSKQNNETLSDSVKETELKIVKEIKNIENGLLPGPYYVIIRQTIGYDNPSTKSKILNNLYPNQKVRLVGNKGKWIYVEFFNYSNNQHEYVWCNKKYLKIISIN